MGTCGGNLVSSAAWERAARQVVCSEPQTAALTLPPQGPVSGRKLAVAAGVAVSTEACERRCACAAERRVHQVTVVGYAPVKVIVDVGDGVGEFHACTPPMAAHMSSAPARRVHMTSGRQQPRPSNRARPLPCYPRTAGTAADRHCNELLLVLQ